MHKLFFIIPIILFAMNSFAQKGSDLIIYITSDSTNSYVLKYNNGSKNETELVVQTRRSRHQQKYIVNQIRSSRYQLIMVPEIDSSMQESMIFIVKMPTEKMKALPDEIKVDCITETKQVPVAFKIKGFKYQPPLENVYSTR
jgi:hypothetical protein